MSDAQSVASSEFHGGASAIVSVRPGHKVHLDDISTCATGPYESKHDCKKHLHKLQKRLKKLQRVLYAQGSQSLLIVLQAMDTGGKDGATKSLLCGVNPAGVHVTSFKAPTPQELHHDFLWRIHAAVPEYGYIGVWNRSHYEDVLIARVHELVPEKVWRARYKAINQFEELLAANHVKLLKFFLHISKDEQKERLQARLDNPDKNWKFNPADLAERARWDAYQRAYEDAINACGTSVAPWYVVPADHKWSRNIAIAELVVDTLEKMNPQYPTVDFDVDAMVVE